MVKKAPRFQLKTARDEDFRKPVYFESMDNLLPTMEFEYDLSAPSGNVLKVGDAVINERTFLFALAPVSRLHPQLASVVGEEEAAKPVLLIRWPESLQQEGVLEVIARTGSVLWKQEITAKKRDEWRQTLESWKEGLQGKGVSAATLAKNGIFSMQFGLIDPSAAGLKVSGESFRFCINHSEGRAQSRLCSQRYILRAKKKQLVLTKIRGKGVARVLLQSKAAPLQQTVPVSRQEPTAFYAELASGESYEFIALPNKLNLMDLTDTKNPEKIRITAWGMQPTVPSTVLNPDESSAFTRAIGFEATIGDQRKFWEALISAEDPKVYLPGQGGGLFTQRFELAEVPRANARPYLHRRTPSGTYVDNAKLFAKKIPEGKITSLENSVEVEDDARYFTWRFKATDRGEINRSYLTMEYQGKEYKAFYEMYKGFPRELSARLSGLVSPTGANIFLGEVAYNQWFESLLGWTNYWVGRQRWGVSGKYFQSLTQIDVSDQGDKASLTVFNADLKYRLVPGLWGRDETVGLMADYQDLTFDRIKAPMVGVGAFWARSMPKVFDDVLNLIPLMRYEKWVDMEFIVYPVSLSKQVTLQTNFALNFHGKVLWTKHWFGEAGFGVKRYAIVDSVLEQKAALNTFYGTMGVGLNF